jgi:alpha-L-rhamnosidase
MENKAKYIWFDELGQGRNPYGLFRKTFEVSGEIEKAILNLFADTNYQLFVNGEFVEFGPVRFDPRFPLYDTHDIKPYLKQGKNVIAVLVNYIGHKNFKSMKNRAGMIAWGTIKVDRVEINLATAEGLWKCKRAKAYDRYSPKISFALNAIELYDQAFEESGWNLPEFDDSSWMPAVEIRDQNSWGELIPRSIPYMSGKEMDNVKVQKVLPLRKVEDWCSFSIAVPHKYEDNSAEFSNFLVFSTWIYSPKNQTVNVGTFFGDHWINGEKVEDAVEAYTKSMRYNQKWKLKGGWNYIFGKVEAYHDGVDEYFAVPCGKGLIFSADKEKNSRYSFRHSPILTVEQYTRYMHNKPLPYSCEEKLDEVGGWIYVEKEDTAQSPCRETSWDEYGDAVEVLNFGEVKNHIFSFNDYPDGFSIILELETMKLFIPQLKLSGVKGAYVDITYTEHFNEDNVHFSHQHYYSIGDRIICTEKDIDWLCSAPRGGRFIKITLRNTSQDVTFQGIKLRSANLGAEVKGYLETSDKCLNDIWKLGVRTLEANMEDAYVDCSGRERGMYGRDTIIQYHVNLAAIGDHKIMRRSMELFGQSPDATGKFRAVYPNTGDYTISDFALNMLEGYLNYYENTGDASVVESCWEAIQNNLRWFNELADEREDLLLDSEWHIKRNINAMYGGFHGDLEIVKGYMDNTGVHCVFSCTYLIALQCALKLAEAIGKTEAIADLNRRIKVLSNTIPENFWDEGKGCFKDNLEGTTHSAHASIFAARAGVVSEHKLPKVKAYVKQKLKSLFVNGYDASEGVYMSPAFAFYIFDGLYKLGLEETAESLMKQGWGWMLAKGMPTCLEYFVTKYSLCHAWSASPTYYLSKNILGINYPKAPNLDVVEIAVKTSCVNWAEGAYPHPKGFIQVKWHMDEGKRVFDYVRAPEGVTVSIVDQTDIIS